MLPDEFLQWTADQLILTGMVDEWRVRQTLRMSQWECAMHLSAWVGALKTIAPLEVREIASRYAELGENK